MTHHPHTTTRRNLIRLAFSAGAARGVPAVAVADPIYELIERHRETMAPWDAAIGEYDDACGAWYDVQTRPFEKPPIEIARAMAEAEERQNLTGEMERAAADAVVETVPTTLPGVLAAIRYVLGHYDNGHELLDDDQTLTFLDTIGDAIEALMA